jgi:Tfp pilus assembly ATPase PilU
MYLDRLFKMMAEKQASDLFISCGAPLSMKINGVVTPLTNQRMDIDTVRRVAYEIMSEEQAKTVRDRVRDEPLASRSRGRQLPDQHLSASAARSRSSSATCGSDIRRSSSCICRRCSSSS